MKWKGEDWMVLQRDSGLLRSLKGWAWFSGGSAGPARDPGCPCSLARWRCLSIISSSYLQQPYQTLYQSMGVLSDMGLGVWCCVVRDTGS